MEKEAVELNKTFIDDIVELRPGVLPRWIMGDGWPKTDKNEKINQVLSELTAEQDGHPLILMDFALLSSNLFKRGNRIRAQIDK